MYFEVQACFGSKSHDLLKDEPDGLNEERIDEGVNDFGMVLSGMFIQDDMVLNEEVRNIVIQVYILGYRVESD